MALIDKVYESAYDGPSFEDDYYPFDLAKEGFRVINHDQQLARLKKWEADAGAVVPGAIRQHHLRLFKP